MNNNNYKITTSSDEFVFRLPRKGSNESINRETEAYNGKVAREIGIDSEMIYFNPDSGLKITRYIEDAETINETTAKRENNMELIAQALSMLHWSGRNFYNDFELFKEIENYKATILKEGYEFSYWENIKSTDAIIEITPVTDQIFKAVFSEK